MFRRAFHCQPFFVFDRPTDFWNFNFQISPQIFSGDGIFAFSISLPSLRPQFLRPCFPAPGPISTRWSAARIVSSSCSITITVFPKSRNLCKVFPDNFLLSRACRPTDGSSRIYNTPTSCDPICEASRILCVSPPARVFAERPEVKYPRPTLSKKCKRLWISFTILFGDQFFALRLVLNYQKISAFHSRSTLEISCNILISHRHPTALLFCIAILCKPDTTFGDIYFSMSSRTASDSVLK